MSRALAFLDDGRPLDYGRRLSRLRWRRAAGSERSETWPGTAPAADLLSGAEEWMLVLAAESLPAFRSAPAAAPGRPRAAAWADPAEPVHTLRELEGSRLVSIAMPRGGRPAALLFRTEDAVGTEVTVTDLVDRLRAAAAVDDAFLAVGFEPASERERPELTRRLPEGPLRILDAGCGAGAGIAGAKPRRPGWTVTGIERDPDLAARARARCDRVRVGDLTRILPEIEAEGGRFDAVVFADVLEHLEDPVAALAAARRIAARGARLLVSVPNVGHLSLVRDLLAGRFDPVPAGLADVHHLRWFTRASLAEAIAESGWGLASVEGEPGASAPDAADFLELLAVWPGLDRESLTTYQWVAIAVSAE